MKALLIFNPLSGVAQIKGSLYSIVNLFSKAGYNLNIHATQARGDAYNTINKTANEYDLIICSGGDGTLNEVVNGMIACDCKATLGYIPAGSTNDYASSLNLPKNMVKAAELIINGETSLYDIGNFNDKHFVYIGAFGAFTQVAYGTPQEAKNLVGHLAYVFEGIKSVSSIKAFHMHIKLEDKEYDEPFVYGMVTNSLSVGGVYKLNRDGVKLDDGLFEVMLIREPKSAIELSSITSYLLGIDSSSALVEIVKTNKICFTSQEAIPWTIDGEYGGTLTEVVITNKPRSLNIIDHLKK